MTTKSPAIEQLSAIKIEREKLHAEVQAINAKTENRAITVAHDDPQGQAPGGFLADHTPRRSRATLRTLDDVALELAKLYRRAERGQIPTADASRLAYILTSLGSRPCKTLETCMNAGDLG